MADSDACHATNNYDGHLGARISAIFVIFAISTAGTLFPLLASRHKRHFKYGEYLFMVARFFGSGVIVATAFIHLLAPAYEELSIAQECLGGGWNLYDWTPCLVLVSAISTFLIDLFSSHYVQLKYGLAPDFHTGVAGGAGPAHDTEAYRAQLNEDELAVSNGPVLDPHVALKNKELKASYNTEVKSASEQRLKDLNMKQQIAGFLILEFGVLFHSVIIGLNLGSTGDEFVSLYIVIVFHQTFEGIGMGARLCNIPFSRNSPYPWLLCLTYGLCTPIAIAIGIGVRTTYASGAVGAAVVSGVLDALSAGILIYTGFVELVAHDFIFNAERTRSTYKLLFQVGCFLLGTGLMALLGKWA